jgi:hypothetical protein
MSKFPVELSDTEGIVEAVNYLLSGPGGLGQNFDGYSTYEPAYLRPSGRRPWSLDINSTLNPSVYLNIPISNAVPAADPTQFVTFTFATPQATPPFQYGDRMEVYEIDPAFYNDTYTVYSCTTTEVTTVSQDEFSYPAYISGGWVGRDYMNFPMTTDCYGTVTVQGGTDRVFVSAQLNINWEYVTDGTDYDVVVSIVRDRGFQSQTPGSTEYLFAGTVLISEKTFTRTAAAGSGTDSLEAIFTTVLDGPNLDFAYYRYYLIMQFNSPAAGLSYATTIGPVTMGLRSLVAQVVKQ